MACRDWEAVLMARIRSIHPGLFTDEGFASLSMAARVLLLGIWTEADDHGVFEWKPVTLKMRIMPVDNVSIPELLAECERAGTIQRFSSGKSYGLVRNFCRFQRPKKPKYIHPIPTELHTYAGLNEDGSLLVLHQSRNSGEKSPQREEGGGEEEEESGIEKEGRVPPRPDLRVVEEGKPIPIDTSYEPSDRAVEYAYSLGMKKADLNSELSKFIALSMASRAKSYNLDMSFKAWCDRWLDFKRKDIPDWQPPPAPDEPEIDRSAWPIVVEGTAEYTCWNIYNREHGLRPLFLCKQVTAEGRTYDRAAKCETLFPPGFNDFGERIAPSESEDAA
jgi:hypothetical protein